MTIELFLSTVFQISAAIAFTALCGAGVVVSIYYSWRLAEGLIKRRDHHLKRLKNYKVFKTEKPNIRMIKEKRAVVKG